MRTRTSPRASNKSKQIQSTEGGGVLVLFANGLLKNVPLDETGLFGELTGGNPLAFVCMQCIQQSYCKGA